MNNMSFVKPYSIKQLKNMGPSEHCVEHIIRLMEMEYIENRRQRYEENLLHEDVLKEDFHKEEDVRIDIDSNIEDTEDKNLVTYICYIIFKLLISKDKND